MEANTPAYYRARLGIFCHFIQKELPGNPLYDTGKKNSPYELLKQGFIHPDIREKFGDRIGDYEKQGIWILNDPLSFTEICSFNTWFAMHPEKVAGIEMVTTSRDFPLTIKGTKDDISRVFAELSRPLNIDKQKRLRIAKTKAEAKLKLLNLTRLE